MTSKSSTLSEIFSHPVAVFIYCLLFALVATGILDRYYQIIAIITIGGIYTSISIFFLIYKEKVSAKKYRDENERLKTQLSSTQNVADELKKTNDKLEAEIPKVIHYSLLAKEIVILDSEGNADFLMRFEGINIRSRPIHRVRHILDATVNEVSSQKTLAWFNGEEIIPQVKSEPIGQNPTVAWRTYIYLETTNEVLPNEPIKTSYKTFLEKEYKDAFDLSKKGVSGHTVALRTDELNTEIKAPNGFVFYPNPELEVKDVFTALRVPEEESTVLSQRALKVNQNRTKITFKLQFPKLSYAYSIHFNLVEQPKI